jgi:hypothetical protein
MRLNNRLRMRLNIRFLMLSFLTPSLSRGEA